MQYGQQRGSGAVSAVWRDLDKRRGVDRPGTDWASNIQQTLPHATVDRCTRITVRARETVLRHIHRQGLG